MSLVRRHNMSLEIDASRELARNASLTAQAAASCKAAALSRIVIRPPQGWRLVDFRELWEHRELLYFLTWRDVKVRYKQTALGAAWAVLQPLLMMIVFSVFFGRLAHVDSGDLPYPLFAFAGLLPWTFFAAAIANAGNSVVGSERLITKIYFPRLAIPFASIGAALVDFAVAFAMLFMLMLYYGISPTANLFAIVLVVPLLLLAALGVGTSLAALNVAFRDFRYVIPFLVQLWMFATPTVYMPAPAEAPSEMPKVASERPATGPGRPAATTGLTAAVAHWVKWLLKLNPMTGLIAFFRASVLGGPLPWPSLAWSSGGAAAAFVVGCLYFRRVEDSFADII